MARYFKFDWLTFMVYHVNMKEVLKLLDLSDYLSDFLANVTEMDRDYETVEVFNFNGVRIDFSNQFLYLDDPRKETIFDKQFPKMRVDISGSGLDFLRSQGFDVNSFIRQLPKYENIKVNRVDWAYDFVNADEDYLDLIANEIRNLQIAGCLTPGSRLKTLNTNRNYIYDLQEGCDKQILYIGATRSERKLRIYDKYLQYVQDGIIKKEIPEFKDDPIVKSWLRVELQTRHAFASSFLKTVSATDNFYENAWSWIAENYTIMNDFDLHIMYGFEKLFSYVGKAPIILNENYKYVPVLEQVDNSIEKNLTTLAFYFLRFGFDALADKIYDKVHWILFEEHDPRAKRVRRALAIRISRDLAENRISLKDYVMYDLLQGFSSEVIA